MRRALINKILFLKISILLLLLGPGQDVFSQSYGLCFSSSEVPRKERTGIDLDEEGMFRFNNIFELKFDIKLRDLPKFQYGYIARIITREGKNIDLVYNQNPGPELVVVCQGRISDISFKLNPDKTLNKWMTLRLTFDISNDRLKLSTSDTFYTEQHAGIAGAKDFKILFGENSYKIFEAGNVAPMDIKDIFIVEDNTPRFHWPLNEKSGNNAKDIIHGKKALVNNPVWLNMKHQRWEPLHSFSLSGNCRIVYNEREDALIVIGEKELLKYYFNDHEYTSVKYTSGQPVLTEGSGGFINPTNNELYTFSFDQQVISRFDEKESRWGYEPFLKGKTPILRHYNDFFISEQQSLILIGGFNGKEYKNQVYNLNLFTGNWRQVIAKGDVLPPRYLSALGLNERKDTAFILGGYGSNSGNPILNPHFYSDLYSYSIKDSTFTKVYDFESISEYFFYANSMVIDTSGNKFYVLRFSTNREENVLQLLQGSLQNPNWLLKADKIQYNFQESKSYADLFLNKSSTTLVSATTQYSDSSGQSLVNIYSIAYPPNTSEDIINSQANNKKVLYWFIIIIGFDLIVLLIVTVRKRIRKHSLASVKTKTEGQDSSFFSSNLLKSTWEDNISKTNRGLQASSILLYGGFQFLVRTNEDISGKFSPLLKELFLMILLNSINNSKGISSKNLIEQLWWDKTPESAKNNLAVNIGKLRNILEASLNGLLVNKSGYWKFDLEGKEHEIYCDYWESWKILHPSKKLGIEEILMLMEIVNRGKFLVNSTYEWLDTFKAHISNEITDALLDFSGQLSISKDADLVIKIADSISIFDMINENAMELKCKALVFYGKHSLARDIYSRFIRDYKDLYGEPYSRDFNSIIE